MNISWSPDARPGANRENTLRNQEEAQTFRFSISIIKLLNCIIFYDCYKQLAYVCCNLRDP